MFQFHLIQYHFVPEVHIVYVFGCQKVQWNFSKLASTGTKKYGWFIGVAGFVRLLL
jgi:hypothetical protein